jgi:hypothetical protein
MSELPAYNYSSTNNNYYDFFVREKWNIDRSTLTLGEPIGKGNFGEVVSGILNGSTRVAIKKIIPGIII